VLGVVLFFLLLFVFWKGTSADASYRPGEDIEGLTAELARSIPSDYPKISFTDASKQAGIDFRHFYGKRSTQLPEDMGSGAAWGDYDDDGWLDLFVANEVGPLSLTKEEIQNSPAHCSLYHNNGDGTFSELSRKAGLDLRAWANAAAWGDYDNDGGLDLFVSCFGKNHLYHNNGDGSFSDQSAKSGIGDAEGFWAGASWGDFNRDGYLDIYVCGYVQYVEQNDQDYTQQYQVEVPVSLNPSSFEPERNLLFRNNGDGTFSEVAKKAGVENRTGRSLSVAWCDFDGDGLPDLYVANDVSDNVLYHNLGKGAFKEISHQSLVADYRGAMGIGIGDWDGDADLDMFLTHWVAQENALYDNLGNRLKPKNSSGTKDIKFMDEADRYGLGQIALDFIGFGTSFFDYDNDGKLDIFVANGSTFQQKEDPSRLIPMQDQLFWNHNSKDGFYEVSAVSGEVFQRKYVGRGAAFGDYDNDGDLDVFVVNNDGPGLLLRNDGGDENNWLKVKLTGTKSNRSAIGAKIRLISGESVQIRQVDAQSSYCSQNNLVQHFGLGERTAVDTLEIIWPAGTKEVFQNLQVNQTMQIIEGKSEKRLIR